MRFFITFSALLLLFSCSSNKFDVTLTESVNVRVDRFDLAFDSLKQKDLSLVLPDFVSRYQNWLPLYCNQIIRIGDVYSADFPKSVSSFFEYPEYTDVTSAIQTVFPHDSSLTNSVSEAFSYYHHYFPEEKFPLIFTYNGGFNQSITIGEGIIGVGLDKYLGADSKYYRQLGVDNYKVQKMKPEQLLFDIITAQIIAEHPTNFTDENVLAEIIHEGRSLYLLHACFPFEHDSLLLGISAKKADWLYASERSMWEYMIDKKILFDTEYLTIKKFTGDGPFTSPFSKESPARAAVWVGYRIVSQFMDNTETSMAKLFEISDYQYILNKSKYNP